MLLTLRLLARPPVVLPGAEAAKTKAKQVMVEMKSVVTGHKYSAFREKLADKLEVINWDPLGHSTSSSPSNLIGKKRILRDKIVDIYKDLNSLLDLIGLLVKITLSYDTSSNNGFGPLVSQLSPIVVNFQNKSKSLEDHSNKLNNLAALCRDEGVPFLTWDYAKFARVVHDVSQFFSRHSQGLRKLLKFYTQNDPRISNYRIITWLHEYQVQYENQVKAMIIEADLI